MRRIKYRKKRNRGVWGLAYVDEYRIELDPDLDDRTECDIALHEGLHVLFPYIPEADVDNGAKTLSDLLWRLGFRKHEGD